METLKYHCWCTYCHTWSAATVEVHHSTIRETCTSCHNSHSNHLSEAAVRNFSSQLKVIAVFSDRFGPDHRLVQKTEETCQRRREFHH